ncbi:hypothetical protein GCK72_009599 [Caenorhabditis remanei]|uniref:General transcription factor IIH subunit 3 n=1 Tax=Caenorhabditis remanei TaxID=31234 RepID=A0A6A5H4A6_CAERE|nr:hypothetical protein GCK72_009599 [Caenorhabditis remanei]KAF1761343.1 hypothetical protein GCK72_009599 [Caenorhabditis remanei]
MSTLSVLIEASSCSWGKLASQHGDRTIGIILRSIVSFCNAHLGQSASNQLLVFAYGRNESKNMIYSSARSDDRNASFIVVDRLKDLLTNDSGNSDATIGAPLGPALAHAFCHMKKDSRITTADPCDDSLGPAATSEQSESSTEKVTNRAVVISMSPIMGSEHGSLMNLFFSAAKQSICVDVVSMGDDFTGGILQQAADITGGSFLHAQKPPALLKILMTNMLTDPSYRTAFSKLSHSSVDYRASCACHHKLVSSGWVCSVCLSVLCQYTPICKVCRAAFTITNIPKKPNRKRTLRS